MLSALGSNPVSIDHPLAPRSTNFGIHLDLSRIRKDCSPGRTSHESRVWKICAPLSDPFRLAANSAFLAASVGVVAPISRYDYTGTTAKSPWIICRYTPREHRRYKLKEGKSTRDRPRIYRALSRAPLRAPHPLRTADASCTYVRQNFR